MGKSTYDHARIEKEAQDSWAALDLYTTDLTDTEKDPYYLLFEFPYPSGDLHIGHWYAFALTDIYARFLRMQGKNVLFPIGFDAFGLPAENAAIKYGKDPKEWTYANMERMREQIRSMGTSVDWSKEVMSCDPSYYKWTQWLFTKLMAHGLAERRNAPVKWCPKDQTVLANEQVLDGKCERCGTEVEEKNLTQWFLRITQYAKRLLEDLDPLPWREEIKDAQRAWIGESEGARLYFAISDSGERVEVFTTRPDTVYGATYLVLSPEHPALQTLLPKTTNASAVQAYQKLTAKKTERERSENKEKTGVCLEGITAINPGSGEEIPVYIADYVLASYGTGAVMAVPAHDERDFEFAKKMQLPIRQVVMPETGIPRENEEERDGGCAVVFDPKTQKYAVAKWSNGIYGLFSGGIDDGEEMEAGILRELEEESGLYDYDRVEYIGAARSHYHNSAKNVNRVASAHCYLVVLKSTDTKPTKLEAHEDFELAWATADEILANWKERDSDGNRSHWIWFLTEGVGRAIELGLDTTSNPDIYKQSAYTGDGLLIHSGEFSGRSNREAMWDIVTAVGGERTTNYRIRDWLVSRQRYWGCPIPVVYDPEGNVHPIPSEHLPWLLPEDVDFTPGGGTSPLATSKELKERVIRIFGEGWTPEYDTLDVFVDSSWYFLRYLDPKDEHDFSDQALMKKWLPVDRYSGGSEHTTVHLLYARFFHKALYDLALVPTPEPFYERMNRGIILGPDGQKMSKSKGNVVNPDECVQKYGADAVRMYLAFIGPYNEPGHYPWNLDGVLSMRRFLDRVYALQENLSDAGADVTELGKTIQKVGADIDRFKFNTAISALMVLVRELESLPKVPRSVYKDLLKLLAPLAPHLAEHVWQKEGHEGSVHQQSWPESRIVQASSVTVIVQVNGKKRGEVSVATDATQEEVLAAARNIPSVASLLHEEEVKKVVYVPGRILNIVTSKI